jgi:CDP-diacylglycerol--serine O-phosphatidyltransferase
MRLRPPNLRRRQRPILTVHLLPTLVTLANLLAGILALSYLQDAGAAEGSARADLWDKAAWMIFLGMFCDGLDGRVARLTNTTSAFGAQLDSLADVVTFGVVPALLAKSLLTATFPSVSPRFLIAVGVVYVVGASLRLARYNVESARTSPEGSDHLTLVFRGLPSPAAAGVIASLVLLRHEYALPSLDWAILIGAPVLGLLMVSRLPYPHMMNRFLDGSRPIPNVVFLVAVFFVAVVFFFETIAVVFAAYALSGVVFFGLARVTGWPRWVLEEESDEASATDGNGADTAGEGDQEGAASADQETRRVGAPPPAR